MELRFARDSLLNTVLRDAHGRPIYRIETPKRRTGRITTISRIELGPDSPALDGTSPWCVDDLPRGGLSGAYVRTDNASDTDIHILRMIERPVASVKWTKQYALFQHAGWERPLGAYMRGKGVLGR